MVETTGSKASLLVGGTASSPSHALASKRPSGGFRQKAATYFAHAPEPYAAMASRGDWSTELWDIFAQPGGPNMCCLSLWCPCVQYGLLMEQLPPGSVLCAGSSAGGCSLFCALWLLGDLMGAALLTKVFTLPCTALIHAQARGHIRRKYGIQSHPLHDFFITWCCGPCALCQEARETVIRQAAEREDSSSGSGRVAASRTNSLHNSANPTGPLLGGPPFEVPQPDAAAAAAGEPGTTTTAATAATAVVKAEGKGLAAGSSRGPGVIASSGGAPLAAGPTHIVQAVAASALAQTSTGISGGGSAVLPQAPGAAPSGPHPLAAASTAATTPPQLSAGAHAAVVAVAAASGVSIGTSGSPQKRAAAAAAASEERV